MKQSKDKATIYMMRNLLGTFFVAFFSFAISFSMYYQCSFIEIFQRIFFYDLYTTLYLLLLWMFDYLVFELSKILYDEYSKQVTFIPCFVFIGVGICVFFIPILDLFQYNLCFICVLIILRIVKQIWKYDLMKKRPKNGLE